MDALLSHRAAVRLWVLCCCIIFLQCSSWAIAAEPDQDEDDDSRPGLIAEYRAGARSIARIDRDVQFVWGAQSPDQRLPAGPFSARWAGKLLVRAEGKHALHLFSQGRASVKVAGEIVVEGERDSAGWVAGKPFEIGFGEQPVEIDFQRTGAEGTIRLFWSSDTFPLEPVSPQLLFHDEPRRELERIERGHDLYESLRCQACHRREHEPLTERAPSLLNGAIDIRRQWLTPWLIDPHKQLAGARMPSFGFSRDEAEAVAEFLKGQPVDAAPNRSGESSADHEILRKGEVLFRSIGCLACHTRASEGKVSLRGGDLTHIGQKRDRDWLERWLREPEKLNPDHRMPVFKLTDDERHSLAQFLSAQGSAREDASGDNAAQKKQAAASGRILIEKARCAACHRMQEIKLDARNPASLEKPIPDWSRSCIEAPPDPKHVRPAYELTPEDRAAIRAYVESRYGSLSPESPFAQGERLLRRKGCSNCHARDAGQGIAAVAGQMARLDPALAGQSEALVPPDLTAVGDKLRDEYLNLAIAGKQKAVRLPWLSVRMPRFEHAPAEAQAIVAYLVGHDRIPEGAPAGSPVPGQESRDANTKGNSEVSKAGRLLAGTRGFSCTACHKIASHEPRNVALATHGSDLYLVGDRMRPEFFIRWTRAPLRIIPGMEMPSFERPVDGVLDGRIETQLAALWAALNDRSAPPKIDTSTIEQVLTVEHGQPTKVVRDVFNVGSAAEPLFVPRAFVMGFDTGANLLYDLDNMRLRGTWSGDLARQRSSGKSWFWESVPLELAPIPDLKPDIALRKQGDPKAPVIAPVRDETGRYGRLRRYSYKLKPGSPAGAQPKAVEIVYALTFRIADIDCEVQVTELFDSSAAQGTAPQIIPCYRSMRVKSVPVGFEVLFQRLPGTDSQEIGADPKTHEAFSASDFALSGAEPAHFGQQPPITLTRIEPVTSVPGYDGVRLPLPGSIMPMAITWMSDGTLAFCSLKGQVFLVKDTDGDGIEDRLTLFEEGLAAPYGLIADGKDLIVAHKPELLRLRDTDGDGRADVREIVADGWGYSADYHDWTCGIVRDSRGNLYVGTGSDYANSGREREKGRWRGKVLRIDEQAHVTPIGSGFRYPTGLAITPDDDVFVSDNQGVQNTFNEINHLVAGASYGVPSLFEENPQANATLPAIQVPHPWTRSVNGIFFLPRDYALSAIAGQGIGCEYDNRFLVRFSLQRVGKTFQGAVYPFSRPTPANSREGFLGTLCGALSPRGDMYVGSIYDSGWLGGTNTGDIVRLRPAGKLPVGIREIRAAAGRFAISFTGPIDRATATRKENYEITGYMRKWQGAYATPDSGRHQLEVQSVDVAADGLSVVLHTLKQQEGYVYELTCGKIGPPDQTALWPSTGTYTMNRVPDNVSP